MHYLSTIGAPPIGVKGGTIGLQPHQTFVTGINTTANRPSASAVGEGAQFFDSTLGKPIWAHFITLTSTWVWRDAAGTTV
jgi:hypothetical protein